MKCDSSYSFQFNEMARPAGLEPAAFCLEDRRSIPLVRLVAESPPGWKQPRVAEQLTPAARLAMWIRTTPDYI